MAIYRMAFRCGSRGPSMWEDCLKQGIAAITYSGMDDVDLSKHPKNEPAVRWNRLSPSQKGSLRKVAYEIKPGDIIYAKEGEAWSVEVKGMTNSDDHVFLTCNEAQHAQEHPNRSALFVLSGITLDRDAETATGGKRRVLMPWRPSESALKPLQYQYELREDLP